MLFWNVDILHFMRLTEISIFFCRCMKYLYFFLSLYEIFIFFVALYEISSFILFILLNIYIFDKFVISAFIENYIFVNISIFAFFSYEISIFESNIAYWYNIWPKYRYLRVLFTNLCANLAEWAWCNLLFCWNGNQIYVCWCKIQICLFKYLLFGKFVS